MLPGLSAAPILSPHRAADSPTHVDRKCRGPCLTARAPFSSQHCSGAIVAVIAVVAMIVVAVMVMIVIVMIAVTDSARLGIDAAAAEIEMAVDLVLVAHQDIGTHDLRRFEIAAAMPVGRIEDAARAGIDRGLRIGAERTRQRRATRTGALAQHLAWRNAMLDPVDQGLEVGAAYWPGSDGAEGEDGSATMAHAGRMEQAVEVLHALEAGLVVTRLVAPGHLAIVVEDAARIDELIVAADEGEELSAMRFEGVERGEGIGNVGDIARAVLRDLRIREAGPGQWDR